MNANKNKQNRFHLLAFTFPNLDFSMGYGRESKNQSNSRLKLCAKRLKGLLSFLLGGAAWRGAGSIGGRICQ